jgi:membrane-associated phospholipid phosphatase
MDPLTSGSLDLIRALQSLGGWLVVPMKFFSFLGTEEFYMLILPLVFWCINRTIGIEMVTLLLASTGLNELAKGLLKLPRPFWIEPKLALSTETSFGLPSGHAQNAVVLWGYLATVLRSPWRWLSVLLIFLISLSRLYLGVHFPGDLLVGWTLGLLVLGSFLWLKPRLSPRLATWSLGTHILAAVLVSAAVLALYLTAAAIPAGEPARFGDLFNVAHAQVVDAAGSVSGMILGAWIGLAVEERSVRFSTAGAFWRRALRLVIGLLVLVALRFGLKTIFPEDTLALGLAFRTLRYALMMLWLTVAWPWLFVRLGLAQRESS